MKRGWFLFWAFVFIVLIFFIYNRIDGMTGFVSYSEMNDIEEKGTYINQGSDLELSDFDYSIKGDYIVISYKLRDYSGFDKSIILHYSISDSNNKELFFSDQEIILGAGKEEYFKGRIKIDGVLVGDYNLYLSLWDGTGSQFLQKKVYFGDNKISGFAVSSDVRRTAGWVAIFSFLFVTIYLILVFIYKNKNVKEEIFNKRTRQFIHFDLD